MPASMISSCRGGLRLTVKARPGQGRERGVRIVDIGEGRQALEVTVREAPEGGKANRAILKQLAKMLGVRASALTVVSGTTAHLKVIEAEGDGPAMARALATALSPESVDKCVGKRVAQPREQAES